MIQAHSENIIQLANQLNKLTLEKGLQFITTEFSEGITFSTSFSFEDQAITHAILSQNLDISIFTLDTGRLFTETYSVWSSTNERYKKNIKAYYPQHAALENLVEQKGPNSFYESADNRKECCFIRKVEPLKRALAGKSVWITGVRSEHSPARTSLNIIEWDEGNQIIKYNPLLHWSTADVKKYIFEHNVPYNILHDKGFISIGCAPCTRAVKEGEDFRAGRWWWEDNSKKECGLHSKS
jgi:phosphoadenosine phosphosulfate reductase